MQSAGLVINELVGNFQRPLYLSVKKEALQRRVNLFVFDGRVLNSPYYFEQKTNHVYRLLKNARCEAYLMSSGTLFYYSSAKEIESFLSQNLRVPAVALGESQSGIPSVMGDNVSGQKQAIVHLIKQHKCKRILYVTGPMESLEARQRLLGYQEALFEHHIKFEREHIFNGNFRPESGVRAMKEILATNIKFDAIAFANDDMALGAMEYLGNERASLFKKVKITGFDNTLGGQFCEPTLTSVNIPLAKMASAAFENLEVQIKGKPVPENTIIPAELALRRSCSCPENSHGHNLEPDLMVNTQRILEGVQTFKQEMFFSQLTDSLQKTNLCGVYLSLFASEPFSIHDARTPKQLEMIYGYEHGELVDLKEPLRYETEKLLPDRFLDQGTPRVFVVKSLFFDEDRFGVALYDITQADEREIDTIHHHIAVCLRGTLMMQTEPPESISQSLQQKFQGVERDSLTGLLTQRSFGQAIQAQQHSNVGLHGVLFQLTLHDLGTADRQSLLVELAELLKQNFRGDDVLGRYGTSSFLMYAPELEGRQIPLVIKRVENEINKLWARRRLNQEVNFHLGYAIIPPGDLRTLEEIVQDTDTSFLKTLQSIGATG